MTSSTTAANSVAYTSTFFEPPRRHIDPPTPIVTIRALTRPHFANIEDPMHFAPPEWVSRISLACVEVAYGRRSIQQLRPLMTRTALRHLEILQQVRQRSISPNTKIAIGPVRICAPSTFALEVSLTVMLDRRAFPFAMRLELQHDQWVIAAIEMGPH